MKVDPKDIDMDYPIVDTPFYHWLEDNNIPHFEHAFRKYLKLGLRSPPATMTGRDINCMRCTHMHFYWVRHKSTYYADIETV